MGQVDLPLTIVDSYAGTDRPLSIVGGASALETIDDDTSYVDFQLLDDYPDWNDPAKVSWLVAEFDPALLPSGDIRLDELRVLYHIRGFGTESYVLLAAYAGGGAPAAGTEHPRDFLDSIGAGYEGITRTSTTWLDDQIDVEYQQNDTGDGVPTPAALQAGNVRVIVFGSVGGSSTLRITQLSLRVDFSYYGEPESADDQPVLDAGGAGTPSQKTISYTIRQGFSQPDPRTDATQLACAWDHAYAGHQGNTQWSGSCASVPGSTVDTTEFETLATFRSGYVYDAVAPAGFTGASIEWFQRIAYYALRPTAVQFAPDDAWLPDPGDWPDGAVDVEWVPNEDGIPACSVVGATVEIASATAGGAAGTLLIKPWSVAANGVGPYAGMWDGDTADIWEWYGTLPTSTGTTLGSIALDAAGSVGSSEDVTLATPYEFPYLHFGSGRTRLAGTQAFPLVMVLTSNRASAGPGGTSDWSEYTAAIDVDVTWLMRPPRYRFVYDEPPVNPLRIVDSAASGGTVWRISHTPPNPDGGIARLVLPDGRIFVQDAGGTDMVFVAPDGTTVSILMIEETS